MRFACQNGDCGRFEDAFPRTHGPGFSCAHPLPDGRAHVRKPSSLPIIAMSRLTIEQIHKVAELARLTVSSEDAARFQQQLEDILQYVHRLDQVDTSEVQPMAHAVEVTNVFRPDELQESLPRDQALAGAPQTDGRYFLVPPILDDR